MINLLCTKNRLIRWDITKQCNLKCKHCLTASMYDNIKELNKDEMIEVVRIASKNGVSRIHLLGGEPTVLPYLDEVITEMSKNNISVSMNTNGLILYKDIELCKVLANNNVHISFSIDGACAETHDRIRDKGSFSKVIQAAKNYISYVDNNVAVAFYITLTPDNKNDDFLKLFKIASEIGINNIVLGVLIPMGAGKVNYNIDELSIKDILDKTSEFVELQKCYPNIKVSFPYQTPLLLKYLNEKHHTNYGLCYSKCKSGVQEYQLQPDGVLFQCILLTDQNKLLNLPNKIRDENNILKNEFESIVNNSYFHSMINNMNNKKFYSHVEPCNVCPYNKKLDICRPCSHQHNSQMSDSVEFHKNKICIEILSQNNNNFYY